MNEMFIDFAMKRMAEGADEPTIAKELVGMGMPPDQAQLLAAQMFRPTAKSTGKLPLEASVPLMIVFALLGIPLLSTPFLGLEQAGQLTLAYGTLVSLVGWIWILVVAFEKDVTWGVACLLCNCAAPIFILMHVTTEPNPKSAFPPTILYFSGILFDIFGLTLILYSK